MKLHRTPSEVRVGMVHISEAALILSCISIRWVRCAYLGGCSYETVGVSRAGLDAGRRTVVWYIDRGKK